MMMMGKWYEAMNFWSQEFKKTTSHAPKLDFEIWRDASFSTPSAGWFF